MAETTAKFGDRILPAPRFDDGVHTCKDRPSIDSDTPPSPAPNLGLEAVKAEKTKDYAMHDGLRFSHYMIAGSVAGMVEHLAMYPVDTLKTRMQMMRDITGSARTSLLRAFGSVLSKEGVSGLYRGIGAMALGAGPAHAVYFSVYEVFKEKFGGNQTGHHPLAHGAAGIVATIASDAVFTPMDVVKQRLQLPGNAYRGVLDCLRKTVKEEGVKALYVSYRTTVIMNAPYTATHFATYEAAKSGLKNVWPDEMEEENLFVHLTAGGAAGALASIVTTPLDVVKTRLQCQGVNGAERFTSSSILNVTKRIVENEGSRALFKGVKPRVLFYTPAAAICWSTYEASKSFLQKLN